jgi:hypothetical protein
LSVLSGAALAVDAAPRPPAITSSDSHGVIGGRGARALRVLTFGSIRRLLPEWSAFVVFTVLVTCLSSSRLHGPRGVSGRDAWWCALSAYAEPRDQKRTSPSVRTVARGLRRGGPAPALPSFRTDYGELRESYARDTSAVFLRVGTHPVHA